MADRIDTSLVLSRLATLELPAAVREQLDLPPGVLELRRAWPRSPHRVGLEYVAGDGRIVVGQWFDNPDDVRRVARAMLMSGSPPGAAAVVIDAAGVLLQTGGADRRLPGLASLVARPGAQLLVHRPERRAVVRLQGSDGPNFAKVVRPNRARSLIATGQAAQELAGDAFAAPRLLNADVDAGVTVWSGLAGRSLLDHLRFSAGESPAYGADCTVKSGRRSGGAASTASPDRLTRAARATGQALRALHTVPPAARTPTHSAAEEIGVLLRWRRHLETFAPDVHARWRTAVTKVVEALVREKSPCVLLHRDFYDKQVFIDDEGRVGILDFDTMAAGEAALDLANALIHLELRALQGRSSPARASAAATALLEGYQPASHVRRRLSAYADASRLRLACVYAFRPHQREVVAAMLDRVG